LGGLLSGCVCRRRWRVHAQYIRPAGLEFKVNIRSYYTARRKKHFTTLPNEIVRSPHLSLKAKGLLLLMLSYPDDWDHSLKYLSQQTRDGLAATRSAFNELAEAGYVTRNAVRDEAGRLRGWQYVVGDEPTDVRFSHVGESDVGEPHVTKTVGTKTDEHEEGLQPLSAKPTREDTLTIYSNGQANPPTKVAGFTDAFLEIWNDNCGALPVVRIATAARRKKFAKLRRELGAEAEQIFRAAARQVAGDPYWVEKGYGLDNLLVEGRVVEKAEKFAAGGGLSAGDRKLAGTAKAIADAIGGL